MIEAIIASLCLLVVVLACVERINAFSTGDSHCERLGFVILLAGCVASIAEWWLSHTGWNWHAETVVAVGMSLIALSVLRPRLRAWLAKVTGRWDGIDRRRMERTARAHSLTDHWRDRFGKIE